MLIDYYVQFNPFIKWVKWIILSYLYNKWVVFMVFMSDVDVFDMMIK